MLLQSYNPKKKKKEEKEKKERETNASKTKRTSQKGFCFYFCFWFHFRKIVYAQLCHKIIFGVEIMNLNVQKLWKCVGEVCINRCIQITILGHTPTYTLLPLKLVFCLTLSFPLFIYLFSLSLSLIFFKLCFAEES